MASRAGGNGKKTLSIGEAVYRLRADYPDLSISKVRYLEDEGLLKLDRTPGGYRQFTEDDLNRLAEVLRLQKVHFLPLTVIKQRMSNWTAGEHVVVDDVIPDESEESEAPGPIPLSEALKKAGASAETIKTLESFGLIGLIDDGDGLRVTPEDFEILKIFSELNKFGIEPRHLRMYENQAQREALLFQQILSAQLKHKSAKMRRQSTQDLRELIGQTEKLKRVVLEKALRAVKLWD